MKIVNLNIKNTQIPVIFESSKSLPIVCLKLIFKAAGSCQDASKSGLANLAAKVLNEGTLSKGSSEFAKELEMRAINIYASAGFETMSIELNCMKEHFSFALSKLEELFKEPNLTEDILSKLKTITIGDILNRENNYDYVARSALNAILYPNTALANKMTGTKESVEKISLDNIKNFLKTHLDLANLIVVFGGDVSIEELELERILSDLNVGKPRIQAKLKTSDAMNEKLIIKPSEQAYIHFGAPFYIEADERFKAKVAMFILGEGGFGSRLMEQIRVKRGLAYSAYARGDFALSYNQISGYLQTKNENKDKAISVVKSEFEKFVKNGVSAYELNQAKRFLLGSEPLSQETLFNRLNIAYTEVYFGFKLGYFKEKLEKISRLKLDELNEFIMARGEINKLSFAVLYNEI